MAGAQALEFRKPQKPSPRITRSKSGQNKPNQPQPSPLPPQVDGATDRTLDKPSQTCNRQDKDYDRPDDWFEQLAAGTWRPSHIT